MVPEALQEFTKDNEIQLLTHSDSKGSYFNVCRLKINVNLNLSLIFSRIYDVKHSLYKTKVGIGIRHNTDIKKYSLLN